MLSARIGHVSKAEDYEKWRECGTEDDMFYGRLDHLVYKPESTPEWGEVQRRRYCRWRRREPMALGEPLHVGATQGTMTSPRVMLTRRSRMTAVAQLRTWVGLLTAHHTTHGEHHCRLQAKRKQLLMTPPLLTRKQQSLRPLSHEDHIPRYWPPRAKKQKRKTRAIRKSARLP